MGIYLDYIHETYDMTPINEGVIKDTLKKFIDGIKKIIVAAIDKINKLLDKHPDSKIAQGLKSLLTKFKNFLTRADKVESKEDAESLKSDVDKATEELNKYEQDAGFDRKLLGTPCTSNMVTEYIKNNIPEKEGFKRGALVRYKEYSDSEKESTGMFGYIAIYPGYIKDGEDMEPNLKKDGNLEIYKIVFKEIESNFQAHLIEEGNEMVITE